MREAYGVVGAGVAPRKVIEAGLNDIGVSSVFIIPWYGKMTDGGFGLLWLGEEVEI